MGVYVPYSNISKRFKTVLRSQCLNFFLKASDLLIVDYWKRFQTDIGTNARKGSEIFTCRKIKQILQDKSSENWIAVNIDQAYVGSKSGKKSQDWISYLLTVLTNLVLTEKI